MVALERGAGNATRVFHALTKPYAPSNAAGLVSVHKTATCRHVPTLECSMTMSSLSSRELNHDVSSAKKAAQNGPVIITDRGKPSHVLMTYDEFERLSGRRRSLIEALSMPGLSEIDFAPERVEIAPRMVDLS